VTALSSSFQLIQIEGHPPLDSSRTSMFTLWWDATMRHPSLGADQGWLQLGSHIVAGDHPVRWVSNSETEPWDLPDEAPGLFLDELEALIEDEEGTDLQHLSWVDGWDGE
jgi:hypothetical protein